MADVQVTSAELKDGVLTVTGSGFTKTTTTLYVDGVESTFETAADFDGTEITVSTGLPPKGPPYEVYAAKGGIESARIQATDATAGAEAATESQDPATQQPPEQSTTEGMAGQPDPQTQPTGSGESPGTTTTPEAEQHEPIQVEGQDLSESERNPQPEPDHMATQTEQAEAGQAAADQENQEPYSPTGDAHEPGYKTAEPNQTPGDLTEDDLKGTSDVDPAQLGAGVSSQEAISAKSMEANQPDREPLKEGEHLPGKDFRFKVENTAAGDLGKTIGPRDPYPKDNPPDPKEEFYRIHGHYQGE